jgi:hypothetical protein
LHAAHPRRDLRVLDIQFDVGGELAGVAVLAQVVGPQNSHWADGGQHWFTAQFPIASLLPASARKGPLIGNWDCKLQQFGQGRGAGVVHRRANRHFDSFQVQAYRLIAALEEEAQQLFYFARNLLADGLRRFFSSGERVSATGRARQIFSFTSSNS